MMMASSSRGHQEDHQHRARTAAASSSSARQNDVPVPTMAATAAMAACTEISDYPGRKTARRNSRSSSIASLALPWASLVVAAIVAAAIVVATSQQQQPPEEGDVDAPWERALQQGGQQQHHHRPVYNEEHEPLFPLSQADKWGFGLATVGLMIAAGGGIGGGGILVPIYILVMGFSPKHAIPLSNITVFGGAVANTVLNVPKRHPLANRPLVDWDLILVMEPLTIGGALIGAFLNKILPELVLTVMLVLLLSFTAYGSLKKATKMYRKETRELKMAGLREDGTKESELTAITNDEEDGQADEAADSLIENAETKDGEGEGGDGSAGDDGGQEIIKEAAKTRDRQTQKELEELLEQESHIPTTNIMVLAALFVVILSINLLKGGGAFKSPIGIRCGSTSFWISNAVMIGWILVITVFVRYYLVKKHEAKLRCGYEFVEGDIQWDSRATVVYPVICCAAGFL